MGGPGGEVTVIYIPRFEPSSGSEFKMDPAVPAVWKTSRGLESFGLENVEGIMTHFSFEKEVYYSLMILGPKKY